MNFTNLILQLMSFINLILQLLQGLGNTLLLFFLTLIFSLPLGMLVTFGRRSRWAPFRRLGEQKERLCAAEGKPFRVSLAVSLLRRFKPIQLIVKLLISILRGTPLMLQIIVVFFGPYYLFQMKLSAGYRIIAVVLAFSINYAAYFAEIFRAGIESTPVGQYEAAQVLGYSKNQTFFKIILPQMIKRVLPPVTNEVITLVKDTSLAFVITYTEMFTIAKQIAAAKTTIMPLFVAGVFYFIFNAVVAWGMERIEHCQAYYQ